MRTIDASRTEYAKAVFMAAVLLLNLLTVPTASHSTEIGYTGSLVYPLVNDAGNSDVFQGATI